MFRGNKIFRIDKFGNKKRVFFIPGIRIKFKGKNSTVTISEPFAKFMNCRFLIGDNCNISIDSLKHRIKKLRIFLHDCDNNKVYIGENFHLTNGCEIVANSENNLSINIGNNCIFAQNITLRAVDGHIVKDFNTGKILNYGKDITVGNNVWLATNVYVLKGVNISDHVIFGANSVVPKGYYDSKSIYAGNPAKLVKTGITWQYEAPCVELDYNTQIN